MDGFGRLVGSVIARLERAGGETLGHVHRVLLVNHRRRLAEAQAASAEPYARPSLADVYLRRASVFVANLRIPRGTGLAATAALMVAIGLFGVQRGGHWPAIGEAAQALGDDAANGLGMRVQAVRLAGNRQLTEHEILDLAGISPRTSVLFFDPLAARERLKASPWIAQATIQKLYPDQLMIKVVEREAFARWQNGGRIRLIAADGAVLSDRLDERFAHLPLVVGPGAQHAARDIVAALAAQPVIASRVAAATLVAERRWTLVMTNGVDVRLPDQGLDRALAQLARLDADKRLLSRDVEHIDLRVPGRVGVRLTEDAFRAHEAAVKERQRARARRGTDT